MRCRPCVSIARAPMPKRLMRGEGREAEDEPGWLGGLPVAIKDLTDVAGVRTTYGSPIFRDHVPDAFAPGGGTDRAQGRHRHRKVEHAGIRRRRLDLQRGVRPTRNPWNTALTRAARPAAARPRSRPARSGSRTAPTMRVACAGPPPIARWSACGPRRAGSRAARPTICFRRCRCRDRWRATWPTSRCFSTPWPACARAIP